MMRRRKADDIDLRTAHELVTELPDRRVLEFLGNFFYQGEVAALVGIANSMDLMDTVILSDAQRNRAHKAYIVAEYLCREHSEACVVEEFHRPRPEVDDLSMFECIARDIEFVIARFASAISVN